MQNKRTDSNGAPSLKPFQPCFYSSFLTTLLVACSAILAATPASAAQQPEVLDGLAAIVNGQAVTCSEVNRDAGELLQQLSASGMQQLPDDKQLHERALEQIIAQLLQKQEATKLEISVSDDEIQQAMSNVETQNNIPAGQLEDVLRAQGMDVEQYRQDLSDRLLVGKLSNIAVRSRLQVSEEAMREYYRKHVANTARQREIDISQITLALPLDPTPEAVANAYRQMNQWRQQVQGGASFARIAELNSVSPESSQGGHIGWVLPGAMPPRFSTIFSLQVGELSMPIRSPGGLHLFRVNEENWKEPNQLAEAYDEVHARHILLKLSSSMSQSEKDNVRQRATQIAEAMQDTSDEVFATRAKELSQGPSAPKGGDLGWFKRGAMLPEFEQAAFDLQAGQTSGVVQTVFGLHIIRVVERRHIEPDSFEAHHDEIQNILLSIDMQDQLPRWLSGLKARATIERRTCP